MVFSSITFLIYVLPWFLLALIFIPKKQKNLFILFFSIFFYSWGGPKFIFVILLTTFLDFQFARFMHAAVSNRARKIWLWLSVGMNLGLLGYFKYLMFFSEIFNTLFGLGVHPGKILLPLGISFYTFESITYLMDVYRKVHPPLKNFWDYQTYILLFPKLIAGPIVRYHEIADQMNPHQRKENYSMRLSGISIFCVGLAKKTLLANTFGLQADAVFNLPVEKLDMSAAWTGALAYTFQIYFDFSGYSDMAVGLCRIMGFHIPDNFLNPYTSGSITEFWRKWHITLGRWMKNYLYIPLGGNRRGTFRTYFNLWIVFVVSGLWHGAGWTFITWGIYHGFFLVAERLFSLEKFIRIPLLLRWTYTFLVVMTGWVLFRAENMNHAEEYLKVMYSFDFQDKMFAMKNDFPVMATAGMFFSLFVFFPFGKKIQDWWWEVEHTEKTLWIKTSLCVILYLLSLSYLTSMNFNPFIYFRF